MKTGKRSGRIIRRLLGALIILAAGLALVAWLLLRASLPQLDGTRALGGVHAQTTIARDALGVVTIQAQSRNDAMFALGFVHAQERFFEMDLMRRMAAGELAELVGGAAVDMDKQHRPFRMRERALAALAKATPVQRATLDAYADGVNAGLAALASRPWEYWLLGEKPAPWTDADCMLAVDAMFFDLNGADNARELAFAQIKSALGDAAYKFLSASGGPWDAPLLGPPMNYPGLPGASDLDLRKTDPKFLRMPPAHAEEKAKPGSNGFAVNGALTATHAALVADDMHLPLRVPNIWFRARIEYPNPRRVGQTVDLIGVTLPGLPALVAGSNRHVAWGFTNSYGDWMDFVRVTLDHKDPSRYKTADGWKALEQSTQIIKVHDATEVKIHVRDTQWGPILAKDADGTPLALAWTAIEPGGVNMQFARMDTAETVGRGNGHRQRLPACRHRISSSATAPATSPGRSPEKFRNAKVTAIRCCPATGADRTPAGTAGSRPPITRVCRIRRRSASGPRMRARMDWQSPDYAKLGDGDYDFGARARQIRDDLKAKTQFTPDDMLAIQLDDRALLMRNWHDAARQGTGQSQRWRAID